MTDLEKSIENTLESSDLTNINVNFAELTLDALINDGTLKDLPVVSTIVGLAKFGMKTQELILAKKIIRFLTQLGTTSIDERKKFIAKIEKNETYNKKVGLAIILILDKLEDLEKPEIVGKLLSANIKGVIDYKTFLRLSSLIQRLFLPDLEYVRKARAGNEIEYEKQQELYLAGFMKSIDTGGARFDGRSEYAINTYAETLLDIIEKE